MEKEAMVYLGPSFPEIIQKGTVLMGGYPPRFGSLMKSYPFLKGLLIPTKELAEKRKELRTADSEISFLYQKAEQIK